jgi:hypothetical protein
VIGCTLSRSKPPPPKAATRKADHVSSRIEAVKAAIPPPARKQLSALRSRMRPSAVKYRASTVSTQVRYQMAVLRGAPLDVQVRLMVPPAPLTAVWWAELEDITLQTKYKWRRRERPMLCVGGDWDLEDVRPRMSIFDPIPEGDPWYSDYETVRTMFIKGEDFRSTPQYARLLPGVQEGRRSEAYFKYLATVFESMREHGYLSQEDLRIGNSVSNDMVIHVTRNGQLAYGANGGHRIGMAEILGIRWVPFHFMSIHPLWVEKVSGQLRLTPHEAVVAWIQADERFRERRPPDGR